MNYTSRKRALPLTALLFALLVGATATPRALNATPAPSAEETYTLIVSGQEPAAVLVSSTGAVVHRWEGAISKIFPNYDRANPRPGDRPFYWRYALLRPNGDLVIVFEGIGIALIDRDSAVRWAVRNNAHHWIAPQDDGSLVHLSRRSVRNASSTYTEDTISILTDSGSARRRLSIPRAIQRSRFTRKILGSRSFTPQGDFLHTNSVTLVPQLDSLPEGVRVGDFLISMRTPSALAIISRRSGRVVWAHRGSYRKQHSALITSKGSLILFDNVGLGVAGPSRVLTYRLPSMQLTSELSLLSSGDTFFSKLLGAVSELPSGNLLITESEPGRAIETTPNGTVLWEYTVPEPPPSRTRVIARLAHAERVAPELLDWLPSAP